MYNHPMPEALTTWKKSGDRSQPFISKSKFLAGRQCLKLVWTAYKRKDLIPAPAAAQQAIFDQLCRRKVLSAGSAASRRALLALTLDVISAIVLAFSVVCTRIK